jgi:hypothetical protein
MGHFVCVHGFSKGGTKGVRVRRFRDTKIGQIFNGIPDSLTILGVTH